MAPRSKKQTSNATLNGDAAVLVVPPYLYLGPRSAASSSFLTAHNITHVLSIGATPQAVLPNIAYYRLSLSDNQTSSIDQVVEEANNIIDAASAIPSGRILVHCSAAVSRSPTIVVAYLMTRKGMSMKDALGTLIRARSAVCPNPGFIAQLKDLELKLGMEPSLTVDILPSKKIDRIAMFTDAV